MPEARLIYKLPEEREEFEIAKNGGTYYSIIYKLDLWLRNETKYHNKELVTIEEVRDKLREIADEYGTEI